MKFWTSNRSRTAKERLTKAEALFWNGGVFEEAGSTGYVSGEKIFGQESSLCSVSITCSVCNASRASSTEGEEMKQQQRRKVMKDMTKKMRSKERTDAENRWWVAELLAADCEKAWLHPGEEETVKNGMFGWRR